MSWQSSGGGDEALAHARFEKIHNNQQGSGAVTEGVGGIGKLMPKETEVPAPELDRKDLEPEAPVQDAEGAGRTGVGKKEVPT